MKRTRTQAGTVANRAFAGLLSLLLLLSACSDQHSGGTVDGSTALDAKAPDGGDAAANDTIDQQPATNWARSAIFYHVYVRSFADSDDDGHGDFAGLIDRLDYVEKLGATAILLLPVVDDADHSVFGGYAAHDFLASERDYGDLASFERLVNECHARGLKLLIDMSFEAAADSHPHFVEALKGNSKYQKYFAWAEKVDGECPEHKGQGGKPYWYDASKQYPGSKIDKCYWTKWLPRLPEWNLGEPAVREMMIEAAEFWLDHGVDGFRLDAVHIMDDHPIDGGEIRVDSEGSHAFVRELMGRIKQRNPDALAVAEVFTSMPEKQVPYYQDGVDMTFDYPVYFNGIVPALVEGDAQALAAAVEAKLSHLPAGKLGGLFLGNHDVPSRELGGRVANQLASDQRRLSQAAGLLLSLPGTPFIYYGEEIGLRGALIPDRTEWGIPDSSNRWSHNPMQWNGETGHGFSDAAEPWAPFSDDPATNVAAQDGKDDTLLDTYRWLIETRKQSPALTGGSYRRITSAEPSVYAFLREDQGERVLVIFNFSSATKPAALDLKAAEITEARVSDLIYGEVLAPEPVSSSNAASYGPTLSAYGVRWLGLE